MKDLNGSTTLENLMKAFAGEAQARNRYTFYATIAANEGFHQIEGIFLETAENECEHARRFFNLMLEGLKSGLPAAVDINATYPVAMKDTLENLKAAAAGENEDWSKLYPSFGNMATQEGYPEVAVAFRLIGRVEAAHEARYLKLANNLSSGLVFKKDNKVFWKCRNCGYIHEGNIAPGTCPACLLPQEYFEVFVENY
jgi:rubrerythrin